MADDASDGGQGNTNGTSPQGGENTSQGGANNAAAGNGSRSTSSAQGGGEQQRASSFTQEDVERIVNERLSRERKKFSDYDQLKQAAKERETANQTLEQQVEALRREQADRDAAAVAEKADIAGERLHAKLVRGGLSDDDASTLLGTIDTLRLLDEGKPNGREIDRLAKALLKIGTRPSSDPDQGKKGGTAAPSMNQMIREAANRTRVG